MNRLDFLALKLAILFVCAAAGQLLAAAAILATLLMWAIAGSLVLHGHELVHRERLADVEDEDNTPAILNFLMAGWRRAYEDRNDAAAELLHCMEHMRAIETEVAIHYSGVIYVFDDGLTITIRSQYFTVQDPQPTYQAI